ncbi:MULTISPECIES: GntR family transcriptional regulator [Clostridia]|uniref:GntR family transcriptional regulator n=1 Tax=Clostridia TaxID=186801 RepID=UPI00067EA6EF|nr:MULTISPECIES: GntR family transcriptional regulator [Clostridia]
MGEVNKKIDHKSMVPMYKQIINILNDKIASGELKPGDKLPSEAELVETYQVSRITIRSAISELEDLGLIVRSRGKGTFVASKKELYSADDRIGFTHSCQQEGKTARTEVLEVSWVYPTLSDVEFLMVEEDTTILCTKRLRYVDGVPTMIETNHYNSKFAFLEKEDLSQSLFDILRKHKIEMGNSIRTLEVGYANSHEASLLKVKTGDALLLFTDRHHEENGNPLFVSRQVYCTERLKFYI